MNKFKKIMLGALSVLTLGLFVVTGAKVNAADLSYSFTHYNSDACYSDLACTTLLKTTAVSSSTWYEKATVSGKTLTINGFGSALRLNNSDGKIDRIGNDTTNAVISGKVDSKYIPTSAVSVSDYSYGYVMGVNAVDNVKTANISFNESKKINHYCYLLVTDDNTNYTLVKTVSASGATSSSNLALTISYENNKASCAVGTDDPIEYGTSNSFGYAVLIMGAKNTETTSWSTSLTVETNEPVAEYHNIYYHDINGDVIESLNDDAEEGTSTKATRATSEAPKIFGLTCTEWRLGSSSGEAAGETIAMGTTDVNLYAYYETDSNYNVTSANKLDQDILQYAYDNKITSFDAETQVTNTIYSIQSGCAVKKSSQSIEDKSFTYYVDTTGKTTADTKAVNINVPSAGYILAYIKNGSSSASYLNLYPEDSTTGSLTNYTLAGNEARKVLLQVTEAGQYRLGSTNAKLYIYSVEFKTTATSADYATATTAAWQNSTKDSLRFVGTISGVSDLSTIDTIELVLLKNDVATKKQIFLNTCFISVSGVGSYTEIENTYYVVYRITGIDSTSMPDNTTIKHKLFVTFNDGSSVTSHVESSKWTN